MGRAIKVIAIVAALVIAPVVIWRQFLDPDAPVRSLTRRIERRIPVGSTKSRVYEFLESERFRFSVYSVGPDPFPGYGDLRGHRERKRYVIATAPVNISIAYIGYDYIRIILYFDEEELLSDYKLESVSDVP